MNDQYAPVALHRVIELLAFGLDLEPSSVTVELLPVTALPDSTPPEAADVIREYVDNVLVARIDHHEAGPLVVVAPMAVGGYAGPGDAADALGGAILSQARLSLRAPR